MEYETTDYVKVPIRQFPAREIRETAEGRYWKQFTKPLTAKQVRGITGKRVMLLSADMALSANEKLLLQAWKRLL